MVEPNARAGQARARGKGDMRLLKWIGGVTGFAAIVGVAVGVLVGAPVADEVDRYFSSDEFCSNTCHTMKDTVAAELHEASHWTRPSGVRAGCADCHVSKTLLGAYIDHVKGLRDLYATFVLGIDTVKEFEPLRPELADRVRFRMLGNDSKNCRSCHTMSAIRPEKKRGQRAHQTAVEEGLTCIICHYNLVHKEEPLSPAFEKVVAGD